MRTTRSKPQRGRHQAGFGELAAVAVAALAVACAAFLARVGALEAAGVLPLGLACAYGLVRRAGARA